MDEVLRGRSATDAKNRYAMLKSQPFFLLLGGKKAQHLRVEKYSYTILQRNRKISSRSLSSMWNKDSASQDYESFHSGAANKGSSNLMRPIDNNFRHETFKNQYMCVDDNLDDTVDYTLMQHPEFGYGFHGDSFSLQQHEEYAMMQLPAQQTIGTSSIAHNGTHQHQHQHQHHQQLLQEVPISPSSSSNHAIFGGMDQSLAGNLTHGYMSAVGDGAETSGLLLTPPVSVHSAEYLRRSAETHVPSLRSEKSDAEDEEEGEGDDEDEEQEEAEDDNTNSHCSKQDQSASLTVSRGERSSGNDRKSTMILRHVQPDLVGQVLALVLSSNSPVDVKIFSQDSEA